MRAMQYEGWVALDERFDDLGVSGGGLEPMRIRTMVDGRVLEVFSAAQGRCKRYGMSKALRLCGLGLGGAHQRALDDAKKIARLLPWIVGGQRLPTT